MLFRWRWPEGVQQKSGQIFPFCKNLVRFLRFLKNLVRISRFQKNLPGWTRASRKGSESLDQVQAWSEQGHLHKSAGLGSKPCLEKHKAILEWGCGPPAMQLVGPMGPGHQRYHGMRTTVTKLSELYLERACWRLIACLERGLCIQEDVFFESERHLEDNVFAKEDSGPPMHQFLTPDGHQETMISKSCPSRRGHS